MTPRRLDRISAARGVVRLAVDGVRGVATIAEGLHGNIARLAPPLGHVRERPAGGIAGFVYGTVRTTGSLVGAGLDTLLAGLQALQPADQPPGPDAVPIAWRAALNGVLGDHLACTGNPLAIPMQLVVRDAARPRIVLFVHGLCMSDEQWGFDGEALDATTVHVRYNSGRHVSENAQELAAQVETLLAQWPMRVESIAIVAHSMGGLVARSAVHQARQAGMAWPGALRQMVFLGTPHHGAALERGGNWLHAVLGASPYLAPFTRLARLRSDGITDLRHGNVLASDWAQGRYLHRDTRTLVPLPDGVACYAIAGTLSKSRAEQALGDGLVSVDSALGRGAGPSHDLRFMPSRTWVARGVNHLALLSDPRIDEKLRDWLR